MFCVHILLEDCVTKVVVAFPVIPMRSCDETSLFLPELHWTTCCLITLKYQQPTRLHLIGSYWCYDPACSRVFIWPAAVSLACLLCPYSFDIEFPMLARLRCQMAKPPVCPRPNQRIFYTILRITPVLHQRHAANDALPGIRLCICALCFTPFLCGPSPIFACCNPCHSIAQTPQYRTLCRRTSLYLRPL